MTRRLWSSFRRLPLWGQALVVLLGVSGLALAPLAGDATNGHSGQEEVAVQAASTASPSPSPRLPPTPSPSPSPSPSPAVSASPSPTPALAGVPKAVPGMAQVAVVERVVDGDTVWVRIDQPGGPLLAGASHKIRLLQIDTPETKHPSRPTECWGPEATEFAQRLLPVGSTVHLLADRQDTDRYGRFLRYLWTAEGTFFNEEAARQGMARAVLYPPNDRFIDRVRAAEASAKQANRGMWGAPCNYDAKPPPPPPAASPPPPAAVDQPSGNCHPSYPDVCIPPAPPDLNCADIPQRKFRVVGEDPHGFDGDRDGIGCES